MEKFELDDKQLEILKKMQELDLDKNLNLIVKYFHLYLLEYIKDYDNPTGKEIQDFTYIFIVIYKMSFIGTPQISGEDKDLFDAGVKFFDEALEELKRAYEK